MIGSLNATGEVPSEDGDEDALQLHKVQVVHAPTALCFRETPTYHIPQGHHP